MKSTSSTKRPLATSAMALLAAVLLSVGISGCGGGDDERAQTMPVTEPVTSPVAAFLSYKDPYHEKVQAAGYVEKTAAVNGVNLSYVEGPDNGPPLVMLHAQLLDWFSYSRVLPELAKSFHVYAIDYQGHGTTTTPANYAMTANQIGADLATFIERNIGQPVYVTGNSSGGLLTTWLAANRPDLVKAVALEDPPLFSSEYPEIKNTVAYRTFATSYKAASTDHPDDFLLYWVSESTEFFNNNFGPGSALVMTGAIEAYRKANPGVPVELSLVENDSIRLMLRGLDHQYDPRFGAAFYEGSWNANFDHATALARIECPVLLMHANISYLVDGTLDGAMSQEQADRAMALLKHGTYQKIDSGHVINLEKPDEFIKAIKSFFLNH